jgi:hypothetical protein
MMNSQGGLAQAGCHHFIRHRTGRLDRRLRPRARLGGGRVLFVVQQSETVPDARPVALFLAGLQLAARRGPLRVDAARHGLSYGAVERVTAWLTLSGACHAGVPGSDLLDQ